MTSGEVLVAMKPPVSKVGGVRTRIEGIKKLSFYSCAFSSLDILYNFSDKIFRKIV